MGDFRGAVGGERANPPAGEGPKKRGLPPKATSSSVAKKTKPVRKKKGPGGPKKSDQKKEKVTRTPRKGAKVTMKEGIVTLSSNHDTGGVDDMEFDEDDMECMNSASFQVLPTRDRAGRTVWLQRPDQYNFKHWKNFVINFWSIKNQMAAGADRSRHQQQV